MGKHTSKCRYDIKEHLYCIISGTCCKSVWCIICTHY
nr:MAG TPA: hypothetical protein [Caudoviricetes sp.]